MSDTNPAFEAIVASSERAKAVGYDEAAAELGLDVASTRHACRESAQQWAHLLPIAPSVRDVLDLVASSEFEGIIAGVRLGRLDAPTRLNDDVRNELTAVANVLTDLARLHEDDRVRRIIFAAAGTLDRIATGAR